MKLIFSQKLMIFFRIFLDLIKETKQEALSEFMEHYMELHNDFEQVVDGSLAEIDGMYYPGLMIKFTQQENGTYVMFLKIKEELIDEFLSHLKVHSSMKTKEQGRDPDYDEVLREGTFRRLPDGIEITIKRGQAN